jgi:hypothetical protein
MKLFQCGGDFFFLTPFRMNLAQARREQQLRQLVAEGVPLRTLGKSGHWIIGSLHIYTASGRWLSEATGRRGRLNGHPIRQILNIEYELRAAMGQAVDGIGWYKAVMGVREEAAIIPRRNLQQWMGGPLGSRMRGNRQVNEASAVMSERHQFRGRVNT